jgi:putative oxidoreductase
VRIVKRVASTRAPAAVCLIRLAVGAVFLSEGIQKFMFLVLLGLLTRPAALLLLIDISTAIVATKIPILLGHALWRFNMPVLDNYGFWSMAHESRTDFSMFLALLFLLWVGAGPLSADARIAGSPGGN